MNATAHAPGALRPLTPKEFSSALDGLRSPRWVCEQIKAGEIKAVHAKPPYLIDPSEIQRFRPSLGFAVV